MLFDSMMDERVLRDRYNRAFNRMDFRDISRMRVTVRKSDRRPVEREKVERLLEAGRWVPRPSIYSPSAYRCWTSPKRWARFDSFAPLAATRP